MCMERQIENFSFFPLHFNSDLTQDPAAPRYFQEYFHSLRYIGIRRIF